MPDVHTRHCCKNCGCKCGEDELIESMEDNEPLIPCFLPILLQTKALPECFVAKTVPPSLICTARSYRSENPYAIRYFIIYWNEAQNSQEVYSSFLAQRF
jgi:hypothetical protein